LSIEAQIKRWEAQREEDEKRFLVHFPETDDMLAVVLRGHLLVEEYLDRLNRLSVRYPECYDRAGCRFYAKLNIARAQVIIPVPDRDRFFGTIQELNTLRNSLAHNLEDSKLRPKVKTFVESVEDWYHPDSPVLQKATENTLVSRLRCSISFVIGLMQTACPVVEILEKSSANGATSDIMSRAPTCKTEGGNEA